MAGESDSLVALNRQILLRLKHLSAAATALAGVAPVLAKLAQKGGGDRSRNRASPAWPCDCLRSLVRAFESNRNVPLLDLQMFFRNMAVLDHLQEGRDMRAEIDACFGAAIPFSFIVLAVKAGRTGVLRPFGIRPGRGEITPQHLKHFDELAAIAQKARRVLVDGLACTSTAWPCRYCGGLMTKMAVEYCSLDCSARDGRRRRYLISKEGKQRRQRGL